MSFAPFLVVSPHLDDAVFGCGAWLAAHPGAVVVTVLAGVPPDATVKTDWDARCGFANAAEALAARCDEDRRALAMLDARPHWLAFCDSQYGATTNVDAVTAALADTLDELTPTTTLYPLGLFHSDHRLVHDACVAALRRRPNAGRAWAYEDALYRAGPGLLQARLAELGRAGVRATPVGVPDGHAAAGPDDVRRKALAVRAYGSQLRAFGPGGYDDTAAPERCWRLEPLAPEADDGTSTHAAH